MNNLICYKTMSEWDKDSLPISFQRRHNTKAGTWAKLTIFSGQLKYYVLDEDDQIIKTLVFDNHSYIPFIRPQAWHKVEPLTEDLRCQLSFYCLRKDYYQKKYNLSATHSELFNVIEAMKLHDDLDNTQQLTAMDMGCGSGRNSLYLQSQDFAVTAIDKNEKSIAKLQDIIKQENLGHIDASVANLHEVEQLTFTNTYDLVISTVVLMFLDADKVPLVINSMQQNTKVGGYNLIVCAIDSVDYPYDKYQGQLAFNYGLKPAELSKYYQNWDIQKYNEDVGSLHRLGNDGNPITLRFATLIAKKK